MVNYQVGLALLLWLCAAWLLWRSFAARLSVAIFGTIALFFCHLVAAVLFVTILFCFECTECFLDPSRPSAVLSHLSFVVAGAIVIALLLLSPTGSTVAPASLLGGIKYASGGSFGDLARLRSSFFVRVLADGVDLPAAVATFVGLGICGLLIVLGARLRLGIAPAFAAGCLVLMALVAPTHVGLGKLLGYRLALPPLLILAATFGATWYWPRLRLATWCVLVFVVLARTYAVAANWSDARTVYAGFVRQVSALPHNSTIFVASGAALRDIPWTEWWHPVVYHLTERAVSAHDFVSTVFAIRSQQPLVLRPELAPFRDIVLTDKPEKLVQLLRRISAFCSAGPDPHVYLSLLYPSESVETVATRWATVAKGFHYQVINVCSSVEENHAAAADGERAPDR